MRYSPPRSYAKVDPARARRIAEAYEAMPHDPSHPLTKAAYAALTRETMAQYHAARRAGFKAEFWPSEADPYAASPRLAVEDINKNNHMFVYPTHRGYGAEGAAEAGDNPMLADSGERWNGEPVPVNDIFRAVHDYFGHAKEGVGFRHDGEENAWRSHAAMYSPLARIAMTNETRGQNSWVNFGPHAEHNRTAGADTVFADQKIGHLPAWAQHEGAEDFTSPQEIAAIHAAYGLMPRRYPMSEGRHLVEHSGARLHYEVAPHGAVNVTELHTEPDQRGRGRAAALMDEFTSALDREGRSATLVPFDPTGTGSLSDDQLQSFYKRRGFFPVRHQGAAAMFRNPRRGRAMGGPMGEEPQPMPPATPGPVAPAAAPAQPEMSPAVAGAMRAARPPPAAPSVPEPAPDSDEELGHSVGLRTGKETLAPFGAPPGQVHNVRPVGAALEKRQRARTGTIDPKDYSDESADRISKWMVREIRHEMKTPRRSGVGWYSTKFQKALDRFGDIHPELKRGAKQGLELPDGRVVAPKEARHLLTALVAITSDGQQVLPNFRQAMDLYGNFRRTGAFTTARGHIRQDSVDQNAAKIQHLFDTSGAAGMRKHLMQEATVSELTKLAKAAGVPFSTDYQANVKLPMAALVLGPKLGAFYANLMGASGYLTMDRWWTRSFNRYRGQLVPKPRQAGINRFRGLLAQAGHPDPHSLTDDQVLDATRPYRNAYADRGFKHAPGADPQQEEIEKAANTLHKSAFEELNDQPFNAGDRSFMLRTAAKAQQRLAQQGVKMSIADIQATLWYYEKRLYGDVGARQSADISYEDAAHQVASEIASAAPRASRGDQPGGQPPQALRQLAVREGAGDHARAGGTAGVRGPGLAEGFADGGQVADQDAPPNPINTETRSRVGNVRFDQHSGAGQVPNNENVNYLGFTAMMKPSRFLTLAHDLKQPRPGRIEGLTDHLAAGNAIGSPFLRVDTDEEDPKSFGRVRQHDGRHRMRAIQALQGDTPVPVHIFGSHGDRARHLSPEAIAKMRARMGSQEAGTPMIDNFGDAFHLGKVLPGRAGRREGGGFPHASKPQLFHSNLGHAHHLHVGPIHSAVHGRTDHLPMHVPSGSYVIPADVVSAHGEGNTMAGFKTMRRLFGGAPYGKSGGPYDQGAGPYGEALQNSRGGRAEDGGGPGVPIVAAGGEYVLSPDQVRGVGGGDPEVGCKVLDEFVKRSRARNIKTLQKLPGPAKD